MHFARLKSARHPAYEWAMALYRESFPFHEQREAASQERVLACDDYHFELICDGAARVGVLLCWEAPGFIYVEHFCIDPEKRNRQYGGRALALLRERGKTVILEIDPPVDETAKRRLAFYQRAQYQTNGFDHVHPPYHAGSAGHRLAVLSCPGKLSRPEYEAFDRYLRERVMGDCGRAP